MEDAEFQALLGRIEELEDFQLVQLLASLALELEERFWVVVTEREQQQGHLASAPWRRPKGDGKGRRGGRGRRRGPY